MNKFFKNIYPSIFIFLFILFIFLKLIIGDQTFFSNINQDLYNAFNYSNLDLSGWRFDKLLGTNFLIGDPSFSAWSLKNIFFKIFNVDKESYELLNIFVIFYSTLSFFYLLKFINKDLNINHLLLISILIILFPYSYEFSFLFTWNVIFFGFINTLLISFNFYKNKSKKFVLYNFLNLFFVFNFGSILALQQILISSFIFFILYSVYYQKWLIGRYIYLNLISICFLILTSSQIIFPMIFNLIDQSWSRSSEYSSPKLFEIGKNLYDFTFSLLFGPNFLYKSDLIGKVVIPYENFISVGPILFNLIFLNYLFSKKKNFWFFFLKVYTIIIIINLFLVEISPFYRGLFASIFKTYPLDKFHIELYIIQILFLSIFFNDKEIYIKTITKVYSYLIITVLSIFILIYLFFYFELFKYIKINNILYEILNYNSTRILKIHNLNYFLFYCVLSILSIFLFLRLEFNFKKYKKILLILIVLSSFCKMTFYSPLNEGKYVWDNFLKNKDNFNFKGERLIFYSDKFLKKKYFINKNFKQKFSSEYIENLKFINSTFSQDFYGLMAPKQDSFSSVTSFVSSDLKSYLGDLYLRDIQEGIDDEILLNNLSIKYVYIESKNLPLMKKYNNLKKVYEDINIIVYENAQSLPYYYLADKVKQNINNPRSIKINDKETYLNKYDFDQLKNQKFGTDGIKLLSRKNSEFLFKYKSKKKGLLVISDSFDKNWKAKSEADEKSQNLKIIKANYLFKAIYLPKGNYTFKVYFEKSNYYIWIYISVISLLVVILFFKSKIIKRHLDLIR